MSAYFECPWCHHGMDGFDYFEMEGEYHISCRSCGKPIAAHVEVELDVMVDKDESAVIAEREKYERRMRGDWS